MSAAAGNKMTPNGSPVVAIHRERDIAEEQAIRSMAGSAGNMPMDVVVAVDRKLARHTSRIPKARHPPASAGGEPTSAAQTEEQPDQQMRNQLIGARNQQMRNAAKFGNVADCRRLCTEGFDVDSIIDVSHGSAAIHVAAASGQRDIVDVLLEAGADDDLRDTKGLCPLHLAAVHGHKSVLETLVDIGAEIRTVVAAKKGRKQKVDIAGWDALMFAASAGHMDIIGELLATDGDLVLSKDSKGRTAADIARERSHLNAAEVLEIASEARRVLRKGKRAARKSKAGLRSGATFVSRLSMRVSMRVSVRTPASNGVAGEQSPRGMLDGAVGSFRSSIRSARKSLVSQRSSRVSRRSAASGATI